MIASRYTTIKQINSGRYGVVYLAKNVINNKYYALKALLKKRQDIDHFRNVMMVQNEILNMKLMSNHKTIVHLHEVIEDRENVYLVEELCSRSTFDKHMYKYDRAKQAITDMSTAIHDCHTNDIVFCDLKPQNILYSKTDACYKLTDFGSSVKVDSDTKQGLLKTTTPQIAAPEARNSTPIVSFSYDVWSFGLLVKNVYLSNPALYMHSRSLESFINACLQENPLQRLKSNQVVEGWQEILVELNSRPQCNTSKIDKV